MKINRITFSIDRAGLSKDQLKLFNKRAAYFEELIFHHLPKNTEFGGYQFLRTCFDPGMEGERINTFSRDIEVVRRFSSKEIYSTCSSSIEECVLFLGKQLKLTLAAISKELSIDVQVFEKAIEGAFSGFLGFEQELKVSKYHRSRRFKICIVRVVAPDKEQIRCRVKNKSGETVDEFILADNTTIYDASFDFRKSTWEENTLVIFDRFNDISYSIDASKYLE